MKYKTFFLVSKVLSFRHTKKTSKNAADRTFKNGWKLAVGYPNKATKKTGYKFTFRFSIIMYLVFYTMEFFFLHFRSYRLFPSIIITFCKIFFLQNIQAVPWGQQVCKKWDIFLWFLHRLFSFCLCIMRRWVRVMSLQPALGSWKSLMLYKQEVFSAILGQRWWQLMIWSSWSLSGAHFTDQKQGLYDIRKFKKWHL